MWQALPEGIGRWIRKAGRAAFGIEEGKQACGLVGREDPDAWHERMMMNLPYDPGVPGGDRTAVVNWGDLRVKVRPLDADTAKAIVEATPRISRVEWQQQVWGTFDQEVDEERLQQEADFMADEFWRLMEGRIMQQERQAAIERISRRIRAEIASGLGVPEHELVDVVSDGQGNWFTREPRRATKGASCEWHLVVGGHECGTRALFDAVQDGLPGVRVCEAHAHEAAHLNWKVN
jgi:hypothetical protein